MPQALYKNVASQKVAMAFYNKFTGAAYTGATTTVTAKVSKDAGSLTALSNNSAQPSTSLGDSSGVYVWDLTQGETNADLLVFTAVCSDSDYIAEAVIMNTAPQGVDVTSISGDSTAADNLEAILDGTGGVALTAKSLTISNSTGTAVTFSSSGSNGKGLQITGNGSGDAIRVDAGASGGKALNLQSTASAALHAESAATTNGVVNIYATGNGASAINLTADSTTGAGINYTNGQFARFVSANGATSFMENVGVSLPSSATAVGSLNYRERMMVVSQRFCGSVAYDGAGNLYIKDNSGTNLFKQAYTEVGSAKTIGAIAAP